MLLKEKWEALYDFSQDREEYDRLCAEMCYNAENNIECAKKLNKLNKKLEFKDTIDNSLLDLKLLEELKDDDKELEKEYFELYTKLEKQIVKGNEAIEKYVDNHTNCTLVNQKNQGLSMARNNGFDKSVGNFEVLIWLKDNRQ